MAMSDAERQRKRRENLKMEALKPIYVRGDGGEFDERIRIALAVKSLASGGKLPEEIIGMIAEEAQVVFPTPELHKRKYINKLIRNYLEAEK